MITAFALISNGLGGLLKSTKRCPGCPRQPILAASLKVSEQQREENKKKTLSVNTTQLLTRSTRMEVVVSLAPQFVCTSEIFEMVILWCKTTVRKFNWFWFPFLYLTTSWILEGINIWHLWLENSSGFFWFYGYDYCIWRHNWSVGYS